MNTLELFLDMIAAERAASPHTLNAYHSDLSQLQEFLQNTPLHLASETQLNAWLHHLFHAQKLSPSSAARKISAIRQFFLFLINENIRPDNPAQKIQHPSSSLSLPKFLNEDQTLKLINAAYLNTPPSQLPSLPFKTLRFILMLEILYATGLRVSELISLPLAAKNPNETWLIVTGKGKKERLVPLHQKALHLIQIYLPIRELFLKKKAHKNNPFFFPSDNGSSYPTRQGFAKQIKKLALKAHINPDNVSPHIIRHAFATHLLTHGADLRTLQTLLGHEDIATTQIYTHILPQQLENTVKTHHPLAKK